MNKLMPIMFFITVLFLSVIASNTGNLVAETAIVHANRGWQRTDIILKGLCTLTWRVNGDDYWSFNPEIFPDGHSADGLDVPALHSYALPEENIGMLLGRVGGGSIISMGLSGSRYVTPKEGGEYLYLTMNDDLIGLYANGFKDNTGELMVFIKQTPLDKIRIDLLFVEGCLGYEQVVKFIDEIIEEKVISADINLIKIDNSSDASRLQFAGSPTVRVGGMDIERDLAGSKEYGLRNRLYCREGKVYSYPSKRMIEDAIREMKLQK